MSPETDYLYVVSSDGSFFGANTAYIIDSRKLNDEQTEDLNFGSDSDRENLCKEIGEPLSAALQQKEKNLIEWLTTSQWRDEDCELDTWYSKDQKVELPDDCHDEIHFFVDHGLVRDGFSLIVCVKVFQKEDKICTSYFDLGEFYATLPKTAGLERVKKFAEYAMSGYMETYNWAHCPSFERIYWVDEKFNPIPQTGETNE